MSKSNIKSKVNTGITFVSKWLMVAIAATLMFAGVINILDEVDKVIAYASAFITTWLLLKEIL